MTDKDKELKGDVLRAPTLSDADWANFASQELSRYLADPSAIERQSLINVQVAEGHLFDDDLPPDVGFLLGMQRLITRERK